MPKSLAALGELVDDNVERSGLGTAGELSGVDAALAEREVVGEDFHPRLRRFRQACCPAAERKDAVLNQEKGDLVAVAGKVGRQIVLVRDLVRLERVPG